MKEKIKILVCCHKPGLEIPKNDVYMPIQCGKAISKYDLGIQGDNTGDNISEKNPYYCELTALYWAWKNLKNIDYIGLCHYRRYFNFDSHPPFAKECKNISPQVFLNKKQKLNIKDNYDAILPASRVFVQPLIDAHIVNCGMINFCILERVILSLYPEYEKSIKYVFYRQASIPQRNMFVMKKQVFDNYASWLFHILFEVEKYVKISGYMYEQRIFGFMGEMLLPLYCYHNKVKVARKQLFFLTEDENYNTFSMIFVWVSGKIRFWANSLLRKKGLYSKKWEQILHNEHINI